MDDSTNKDEENKIDYDPTQLNVDSSHIKKLPFALFKFIKKLISIENEVSPKKTISSITAEIEFKGSSIWILICSIVVASIGLNNNSTAVIIGAMLISPLMGPIRGIGMALATNDFKILIKSLINYGVMVGVSLLASYVFFLDLFDRLFIRKSSQNSVVIDGNFKSNLLHHGGDTIINKSISFCQKQNYINDKLHVLFLLLVDLG